MKWLDRLSLNLEVCLGWPDLRYTVESIQDSLWKLRRSFKDCDTHFLERLKLRHTKFVWLLTERGHVQTELLSKSEPQTESHRYSQLSCENRFGIVCVRVQSLSCVRSFVTPWTVACQAPLSMGFPTKNTGVGCNALLQGIFPTQDPTCISCTAGRFFTIELHGKLRVCD